MDYDAARELHRELVYRLKREVTFYQSLFVLIRRQRDAAQKGSEAELAVSYPDLHLIIEGLKESQFAVATLKQKEPALFEVAARQEPVPQLVTQARELLEASMSALQEGADAARRHYRKLQAELSSLTQERQDLASKPAGPATPRKAVDESS